MIVWYNITNNFKKDLYVEHYVDNQRFLLEITEYQNERKEQKENGIESPPCPDYIGECFLKIHQRLSFRPNFINYFI